MSRIRPPTPAATRAYRHTHYALGPAVLRISVPPPFWPFEAKHLVLIGACNPSGLRLSDIQNALVHVSPRRPVRLVWLA